ncbi:hypothetical protein ACGFY9_43620 [Streptomyces sp. NPDC048504]|uniref:hypothetical protein n=1 Tax=unclassified Streptomyces TaxID=2593676 RepID=UPI00371A8ED6|nr:hypothetical protein OG714_07855 [Streptomyces sp. NBC_00989]
MELTGNRLMERRLSDFFQEGAESGPEALFADSAAMAAAVADGSDPRLYSAARDVLPSRVAEQGPAGAGGTLWSADLVVYEHGTLPGGEPFRSTGHWNPADQLEIFQVLSGRVLMLSSMADESGDEAFVGFQVCRSGELAVVPFGAWHLTYVLDGPAMVFNMYSGPADDGTGADAAHSAPSKYRSRRGPAEITARRSGTGFDIALSAKWREACGDPVEVSCPAWLQALMPPSGMLTDLHVSGSDADLDALLASARTLSGAHPTGAVELVR